jgi:glutamate/tyrosine decarboxylase-like PLP-dependent enzyme
MTARKDDGVSIAECGIYKAMQHAHLDDIQILTTVPHSSLRKAASIAGLGRGNVKDVGRKDSPHRFDMEALEHALATSANTASIIVISCGEVNTGLFATNGTEIAHIRSLCDKYSAWLHVDAAFGLRARCLPSSNPEFTHLREGVENIHLADSITSDAHKLLNVPYDCGIFLSRHLELATEIFQNTSAAYLTPTAAGTDNDPAAPPTLPSPLNIGIENSRRFRALPLYATLAAYGREGYADMVIRQIHLARAIAAYIQTSAHWELLPSGVGMDEIFIIVLFRAKGTEQRASIVKRINASRKVYVSGTQWEGQPAARFAVASWMVDPEREIETVKEVMDTAMQR